jgi:hypothetical protein
MPVTLTCTGCKSTLKVRDDLVGKKIKCPKCATLVLVPSEDEAGFAPVEVAPDESGETPARKSRRRDDKDDEGIQESPRRRRAIADDDDEGIQESPRKRRRSRDDDDDDDDDRPRKKKRKYEPCPQCEAPNPQRVKWTAWGSFYGPAMLSHVRCQECGYCYNGKTGKSNAIAATIFVMVPLVGILAILGAVGYMLYKWHQATQLNW